ncbi:MAG: hypothetical protein ACXVHB_18080 [Solirubrobacteraceae bacterium]
MEDQGPGSHDVRDGGRWSWSRRRPRPCTSFCRGSRAYDDTWGRLASGDAPWLCAGVLFEIPCTAPIHVAVAARAQRGTPFGQRQTISTPRGRLCVESRLVGGAGGHAVASFVCSAGSREPLHELARFWP